MVSSPAAACTLCREARANPSPIAPIICESASAEALLAQAQAGFGAAWIPRLLLKDATLERCDVPDYFDAPYKILLVRPGK